MKTAVVNIENLVRKNVKRLKPYSSARDEFTDSDKKMIFLDANENPFDNGVNRYPDPQQRNLKAELAAQKAIKETQILLGNGSDEVLDLIFRAFCEPRRDNIIIAPPTYGMYKVLAETNAVEAKEVALIKGFQLNVSGMMAAADQNSKVIFICSPNNPSGNSFAVTAIETLLVNFKGIVVLDEAYIDFSEKESWLKRLNEFPNLIVTQTLSKAYGMAGIRLGICYASKEIIAVLNKIKPPYNVNELTQQHALKRIKKSKEVTVEIKTILAERTNMLKELKKIDFIQKIYPSDANFLLVKVDNAIKRYNQLIDRGIVVRNRTSQLLCLNCLRFTIGKPQENKKLINILKEVS